MKKLKALWTNIGLIAKIVAIFFVDIYGWILSVLILFKSTRKVRSFRGFAHFWFAKRYCNKRKRKSISKRRGDMNQCILPVGDLILFVCSQRELKRFQNKGFINHEAGYSKYFKKSYFNTIKPIS